MPNPHGFRSGWFWTPNGVGFDLRQPGESAVDPLGGDGAVPSVFNGDFDFSGQRSDAALHRPLERSRRGRAVEMVKPL